MLSQLLKIKKAHFQTVSQFCTTFKKRARETIIGIDLGTTNSCVAFMEGESPKVIEDDEGFRTISSVVAITADGTRLVGASAKRQANINPENTFYGTKILTGRKFDDPRVQQEAKHIPYKIMSNSNGDACVTAGGKDYSPSQVGSFIITKMKETAEAYLGKTIKSAVISVPAYYNMEERISIREAGELAGLRVRRLINEPVAAALAYCREKTQGKVLAVYDLGGRTFNISILQLDEESFEFVAIKGDTSCGGKDIDDLITEFIIEEFNKSSGVNIPSDEIAVKKVIDAAEKAKCELSTSNSTEINIPYLINDKTCPQHCKIQLSRDKFEAFIGEFLQKTIKLCEVCLKDSGFTKDKIDEIILVGGSAHIPYLQKIVSDFFGKTPNKIINPQEAVACGAAIQGNIIAGEIDRVITLSSLTQQSVEEIRACKPKISNTSTVICNTTGFGAVDNSKIK